MTESDSVNLISCEIAKLKYNLVNIVSIVNSKENLSLFNAYGITELFFQGRSILEVIINSAGVTLPVSLLDIRNKGTSLWSIKIPKDSNAIGMDLSKLNLLGWKSNIELGRGIENTHDWYKMNFIEKN